MGKKIKRKFQKGLPEEALSYFDPASDEAFKKAHPVGYFLLVLCLIVAFLLPMGLYALFVGYLIPAPNQEMILWGILGAMIIGIGICNIMAALIGQYLGHAVTVICFGVGILLMGIDILLLYSPFLQSSVNEEQMLYYMYTTAVLLFPIFYYPAFRQGIDDWLCGRKIRKSEIRKRKKGKRNFWWYEEIHREYGLGIWYPINRVFITLYPITLLLHAFLGVIKAESIPVFMMGSICLVLMAAMYTFHRIQNNKKEYGRSIVLFAVVKRGKHSGVNSIFVDLLLTLIPLVLLYIYWELLAGLWDLPIFFFLLGQEIS